MWKIFKLEAPQILLINLDCLQKRLPRASILLLFHCYWINLLFHPLHWGAINISKNIDDALPLQMIGKQDSNASYEKGISTMTFNTTRDTPRGKENNIAKPIDLQSMLNSLLVKYKEILNSTLRDHLKYSLIF